MPDSNPFRDPTPADLEMLRDEMAGKPLPRKAGEGIADMEARIKQLKEQKRRALEVFGAGEASVPASRLDELNAQIKEATERLAEYQVQQQSLN